MHHLPSFRNSFNACDVSSAAAGEKTGSFFPAKKAQDVCRGEVAGVVPHENGFVCLKSWMGCPDGSGTKMVRAGVSNCMHQCLNVLVLNVHIPAYLGSRGKPLFETSKFFWCVCCS
jgi:hypothetical protein